MIAGAAAVTFAAVFAVSAPSVPPPPGPSVKVPRGGGPARQALAEARTAALYAENEAPPPSEVEPDPEPANALDEPQCVGAACDSPDD